LRRWAGVDVGGTRKGFDIAVVDATRIVAGPARLRDPAEVVAFLIEQQPRVVAVDSPRAAAADGAASRECERLLARAVCGIRYTPSRAVLAGGDPYYDWIRNGLDLYAALAAAGAWRVVECFPTASWTRLAGPRNGRSRAQWTGEALLRLGLAGIPARTSQDARDAIAAAVTARRFDHGSTESFGEIVVPA
jgi:predicted nuclease with RNAse H fold